MHMWIFILFTLTSGMTQTPDTLSCSFPHTGPLGEIEPEKICLVRVDSAFQLISELKGAVSFDSSGMAWLATRDFGWVLLNKSKGVLLWGVASLDNGPDNFRSGLVRIQRGEKWGYCNSKGEVVIPAIYDGAMPFQNGTGRVCHSCKRVCVNEDCEYHRFEGGKWLSLNAKGKLIKNGPKSK